MSLVAWYPLNGDTLDYSGNSNDLIPGGSINAAGKIGQCYDFTSSYSSIDYKSKGMILNYNVTVAFWANLNALPASRAGVFETAYGAEFAVNIDAGGAIQWYYGTSGAQADPYVAHSCGGIFSARNWVHVVLVRDILTNQTKVYKNGLLVSTAALSYIPVVSNTTLKIGYSYTGYMNGKLNDFRIYDHALSDKEIYDLSKAKILHYKFDVADADIVTDCSGYGNNAVLSPTTTPTWSSDSALGTGCYSFNNNLMPVTTFVQPQTYSAITTSAWIKVPPGVTQATDWGGYILHSGPDYSVGSSTLALAVNTSGTLCWSWSGTYASTTTPTVYNDGNWHHITGTWDGTTSILYVDGEEVRRVSVVESRVTTGNPLCVGGNVKTSENRRLIGSVDDVRVYATALSAEDIKDLYEVRANLDTRGNLSAHQLHEALPLGTPENPAASAKDILDSGNSTGDGVYWIIPRDDTAAIPVYCDMTTAGGGWTRVFYHNNHAGTVLFTGNAEALEINVGSPLGVDKYSILSKLEAFRKPGDKFEFLLRYPNELTGQYNLWQQSSNFAVATTSNAGVSGYEAESISWSFNGWGGLEYNGGLALADGSVNTSTWYYAIGCNTKWSSSIPGPNGNVSVIELYVREVSPVVHTIGPTTSGVYKCKSLSEVGPTDGLVGWWKLDGNTLDYSGNKNDGVATNQPAIVSGPNGKKALLLTGVATDGADNTANIVNVPTTGLTFSNGISFTGWVYKNLADAIYRKLWEFGNGGNLIWEASGALTFRLGGVNTNYRSWPVIPYGKWNFFCAMYNPQTGSMSLWLNSQKIKEYTGETGTAVISNMFIGSDPNGNRSLRGIVCDFRIYDRALSSEEIDILYNMGSNTSAMQMGDDGTLYLTGEIKEV